MRKIKKEIRGDKFQLQTKKKKDRYVVKQP